MDVPLGIVKGDRFNTYEEIEIKIEESSKMNFVQLYKRESRSVAADVKKTKRYLDPKLKFYQVEWACIHGGRQFVSRGSGIRQTKSVVHIIYLNSNF